MSKYSQRNNNIEEFKVMTPFPKYAQSKFIIGPFLRCEKKHIEETDLVKEYFSNSHEGYMIDVGAHRGTACLQFLDNKWDILAFEPDFINRGYLDKKLVNHYYKKNIEIIPCAVGNELKKNVSFYASDVSSGISSLSSFHESHKIQNTVDIVTLSSILEKKNYPHINFLKIDTEGHDLFVLQGYPWDKDKPDIIECEFEDFKTKQLGYTHKDLADFLTDLGYTVFVSEWFPITQYGVKHDWRSFKEYPSELCNEQGWGNFIAFKKDFNINKIFNILKSQLLSTYTNAEKIGEFEFLARDVKGQVKKTNEKYTFMPGSDKNYICDIYRGIIRPNMVVNVEVSCKLGSDCTVYITLIRHGKSAGDAGTKKFSLTKGDNKIFFAHNFKHNHTGFRVQIGVNDSDASISNIITKVVNGSINKINSTNPEKKTEIKINPIVERKEFPDVFGAKAKLAFYLNQFFSNLNTEGLVNLSKRSLQGNIEELTDNKYLFKSLEGDNYIAEIYLGDIQIGDTIDCTTSFKIDKLNDISILVIRHGQSTPESHIQWFKTKQGVNLFNFKYKFINKHAAGYRIQLGVKKNKTIISNLSIKSSITKNETNSTNLESALYEKTKAFIGFVDSFVEAMPTLTSSEVSEIENCFSSIFESIVPRDITSLFISAKDLIPIIGKKEGEFVTRIIVNEKDNAGEVYEAGELFLKPGSYIAEIEFSASSDSCGTSHVYCESIKENLVQDVFIKGINTLLKLEFSVLSEISDKPFKIITNYSGKGTLHIYSILVKPYKKKPENLLEHNTPLIDFNSFDKNKIVIPKLIKPLTSEPLEIEDIEHFKSLKDKFKGERIFIMGSGPSLNNTPLEKLGNDYVFGLNRIGLLFERIKWRPTFYTAFDVRVVPDNAKEFSNYDIKYKFFSARYKKLLGKKENHYWHYTKAFYDGFDGCFDENVIYSGFGGGGTIAVMAIEFAFYLGFDPIYLIGVDVNYSVPETVIQNGKDVFGDGVKLELTSTKNDDMNHFDPRYYGAGKKWHNPNVADMKTGFARCRQYIEKRNRRIYNATVGGKLDVMKRVNFEDLF